MNGVIDVDEVVTRVHIKAPAQEEKTTEDQIQVWHTCCSKTEPAFIKYISQLAISSIVLGFSIVMIANGRTDAVYYSLISGVVGYFTPAPNMRTPSTSSSPNS